MQMPQTTSLQEFQTKTIFYVGCDDFRLSLTIIFSIHALHLRRGWITRR